MFRPLLLAPLAVLPFAPAAGQPPPPAAPAGYHHVRLNGHTFTLPAGFAVELAAGSDLVPRPVSAAFDEVGRLYVTDSAGTNEKVQEQLAKKPHRVLRLDPAGADGRFGKATVFVPNVMLPQGAMWLDGSLYVAAPPHILKFTDADDDGRAEQEEIWFDGKTLTGCANDLHGPYPGPDGWIYWCKGAFARQEHALGDGRKLATRASHVFRARPDGRGLEPVMTGGMDNPVGLAFTPVGDRIFSCTFLQHPRDGKRDGLIHAVYGGVYGKPHDVLDGHTRTGPDLLEPMTHLGPAAPCGLRRYESDQFGPDYANNLFCCQFNLRTVSRHALVPAGSTYTTRDSPFLTSDNPDFHPTDVVEDADGSLLVVDTGGWYKLCCPTTQLVKPDVTGAIYRVRKTGAHAVEDPRGLTLDWATLDAAALGRLLHDPRPAVAGRAVAVAEKRGRETPVAAAALTTTTGTPAGRLRAAWLAGREGRSGAQRFIAGLADSPDECVRLAALHMLGVDHAGGGFGQGVAAERLADPSPRVRRAAAECLTLHGRRAVEAERVFAALAAADTDPPLDHALTLLLIEGVERDGVAKGLAHPSPRVRRAVLAALDQMPGGAPDAEPVLRELDGPDAALRETAWWVAGRHPDWGGRLAGHFRDRLAAIETLPPADRDALVARGVPFLNGGPVRAAFGDALAKTTDPAGQRPILRGLARAGLKTFPAEWEAGVRLALGSRDAAVVRDAAAVLRAIPPAADLDARLTEQVARLREGAPTPPDLAMTLRAATPLGARLTPDQAAAAVDQLHRDRPAPARAAAADLLTRQPLPPAALVALAEKLNTLPPAELGRVLPAFDRSADERAGLALVRALSEPAVRAVVRAEQVKPTLDKYPAAVTAAAAGLYARLAEGRRDELVRLEALLKELPAGDVRRGQAVFNGTKGQCVTCHAIGYVGGRVGPDLTRVGGTRTARDLLEAVVFPSASFVRGYEPVRVATADGRVLNGILTKDAPDEIVVATGADTSERVPRADVEAVTPGTVSVMPAGLDQQLTRQELADLVAFLRACR